MSSRTREQELLRTFANLADTLVEGYDVVELLQLLVDSCQQFLDTTAAAILLADADGELDVIASTSEASRLVELIQIGAESGPCVESFTTGMFVSLPDISQSPERWSRFRDGAIAQGFASVHAFPLRLRETRIGTLNLLRDTVGDLDPDDQAAAQAFADVATIGILHERSIRESHILAEQLEHALQSRVVIEQAKGVVAYTRGVPIEEAFSLIRAYARANRVGISQVAAMLVSRRLTLPE